MEPYQQLLPADQKGNKGKQRFIDIGTQGWEFKFHKQFNARFTLPFLIGFSSIAITEHIILRPIRCGRVLVLHVVRSIAMLWGMQRNVMVPLTSPYRTFTLMAGLCVMPTSQTSKASAHRLQKFPSCFNIMYLLISGTVPQVVVRSSGPAQTATCALNRREVRVWLFLRPPCISFHRIDFKYRCLLVYFLARCGCPQCLTP